MNKQIVLTLFCLTLFVAVDAQTVHLSRLQRAAGIGYVPYTDGTGKAAYTLLSSLITPSDFGSGTNNRIAYWLNDTLSSTIWEMNSTYIRGSGTGWPQMENGLFTWRGDTDSGMERSAANEISFHAGDATNFILKLDGTNDLVSIDPNDDATDDIILNDTMAIFEKVKVGIHTDVTTQALAGYDSLNVMSRIIIGNGLTLTPGASYDTLTASSSGATDLTIGGSGPTYTVESSTGSDVTISVAGIASLSEPSANELRITATEVDGSITNEIQSISVTGTTTAVIDLSDDATDASITGAGISTVSVAGNAITITSTEVDGSTSNELQDLTIGGSGPTYTVDIANGADVTIAAAGINTLSEGTANVLTITGTEVDGSITNEIQQLTPSDNGTNFWWALGSSTDSIVLVEGTNITMSRSGDNVTINAASGVTGSGTTGEVAVWSSSSALTSNGWSMTATEFQAGSAGDPRLEASNNFYTFNSDTDTGVKRGGANVLSLHAGDASNNMVELDGTNDRVTFDPNDDATDDIIFRDTMALFEKIYLSTPSEALTTTLTGYDAGNILTEIIIGSGLTLVAGVSNDTLTATAGSDDQQITPGDNGTNFWFALEGSTDSIVLVEGTNVTMSRSGDNVTINAASGVTGSGVATAIATWATASTLTNTDWIILSNTMSGPTLGDPAMSITDNIYSFTGDSNTGLKWSAADIVGIYAGDATNPLIKADGPGVAVTFDPDDDGVAEVTINATTMTTELLDIGMYGTTATKIAGLNASGVVTELVVGSGLSISGDSLKADAGLSGSGSASAVATWSSASALTFTDWLILSNVLQGPTLGDPAMSITDDAYSFTGDSNTGLKWSAADIAGLHAGDATNPMIKWDGTVDAITFDPDDDGTADVSISTTTTTVESLTASGLSTFSGGTRITSHSTFNNKSLLGIDSLNNVSKVIIGSEFTQGDGGVYDTLKLSDASKSRLFYGDDLIGSAQVISVGGGSPYDTIVWTTTFQQEQGITYGAPNASTDSAIIFTYPGVYEISYSFTGELAAAATNVSVFAKWNKNGTTAVSGSTALWGFEETNRQHYSGVFQFTAAANDYIQLLMKNSTASASNLSFDTPKVSVKYVAPQ